MSKPTRNPGALHTWLNIAAAITPETLLTKTGCPLMVLRMEGPDDECLGPAERNVIARRFEFALRIFNEHDLIYQYCLRRKDPFIAHETYNNDPVVQRAIDSRIRHLTARADRLYSQEQFLVIGRHAPTASALRWNLSELARDPGETLRRAFSKAKTVAFVESTLTRECDALKHRVRSFQKQLEDVIRLEILDKQAAFNFLRRLVNYAPHKAEGKLAHDLYLDYQICQSTLECYRDHLELDGYSVRVLTVKEAPSHTHAAMWRKLSQLNCNSIIAQDWQGEPAGRMLSRIQSMRRHHQIKKTSFLSQITDRPPQPHEVLIDQGAEGHIYDLGECQREIELNGHRFGLGSFSIVVYDEDPATVRQAVAECYRILSNDGAALLEERGNAFDAWLATIPGHAHHNRRRYWLMDANFADLAFVFAPNRGQQWNECLDAEYLVPFETVTGSPFFFNLHWGEIAHALILGPAGAGKSFLLNFLLTFAQKYRPWTCIFDIGGSYAHVTRLFNGSYLKIGSDHSCKINPFSLPRTNANRLFLYSFVKVLIESAGCVLDERDEHDLYTQIDNVYEMDPSHRRLLSLANVLNRKLRKALSRWVEGGAHAVLFDNLEDEITFARFQTFEFEDMDKYPERLEPLLFYLLQRATAVVNDPNEAAVFKVFVADEAWRFLKNPTIRDYIGQALRTWRKKNAGMILATQSIDELQNTPIFNVLMEDCPTKIFLANPEMDQKLYCDLFHLTATEADQVSRLTRCREMLLKRPDLAKVLRLDVDPKSYWIFANSPRENQRRSEIFAQHGFEQGLEILARSAS